MVSAEEADQAVRRGAGAVGLVSSMPSGPGVISEPLIAEMAAAVPREVSTFLLTCLTDAPALIDQARRCRTDTLQLVERVEAATLRRLRQELPAVRIVQVLHVQGPAVIDEALGLDGLVDAFLLDSGRPGAAVPELGGTGRVHNWGLSRRVVDGVSTPVILAGGLTPDNVAEAVENVRPFGVDVCSGVRSQDALDPAKLDAFARALGHSGAQDPFAHGQAPHGGQVDEP